MELPYGPHGMEGGTCSCSGEYGGTEAIGSDTRFHSEVGGSGLRFLTHRCAKYCEWLW